MREAAAVVWLPSSAVLLFASALIALPWVATAEIDPAIDPLTVLPSCSISNTATLQR